MVRIHVSQPVRYYRDMFLSGRKIEEALYDGSLGISRFRRDNLKGASYTFTLSSKILTLKKVEVLNSEQKPEYDEHEIGEEGYLLEPGAFVLGYTEEKLTLNGKYICFLSTRGSIAQLGLNVLLGSAFAEPDTDNPQLVEIHNASPVPIKLLAGTKLIKGVFAAL